MKTLKIENDPLFLSFIQYLKESWSSTVVALHIGNLCAAMPLAMASPTLWDIPRAMNLPAMVHNYMTHLPFLVRIWPCLRVVLHDNLPNLTWAASIATTLATCEVVCQIPMLKAAYQDAVATAAAKRLEDTPTEKKANENQEKAG